MADRKRPRPGDRLRDALTDVTAPDLAASRLAELGSRLAVQVTGPETLLNLDGLPLMVSSIDVGPATRLQARLSRELYPFARSAVAAWIDQLDARARSLERTFDAIHDADDALFAMDWWVPPSIPMDAFWRVAELAATGRHSDVADAMNSVAADLPLASLIDGWCELGAFQRRRSFLTTASRTTCVVAIALASRS